MDPASVASILIVDDNRAKRLAIRSIVEPLGHTVVEAASGEAALRAVLEQPFAVILLDIQMPGMDGYETAALIRLRTESEHTPIIFITAHQLDEAQIPFAYASGAVDFIFAPVVPSTLRAKVSIFVTLFLNTRALEASLDAVTTLSEQFRHSEAHTRSILENVADGIITINESGLIESLNRAATLLFGYDEVDAIGQPFSTIVDVAGSVGHRTDGTTFPLEVSLANHRVGSKQLQIVCLRDTTERETFTRTLQHQAVHDALTGLPNRVLFADRVELAIRAAVRSHDTLALLLIDLEGFKHVNDTIGHDQGDVLLTLVAQRLKACLRDGDTVARLGGDEFAILPLPNTDLAGSAAVAWKIQQAFEQPFSVGGHELDVTASIGMSLYPEHGDNLGDLLRRADLAMYDAKRSGAGFAVFAAEHEDAPARRLALLGDLRQCISSNELVLHYQPKIDLQTQRTIGVEALIRWNHPTRGLLQPAEFMPQVEASELIIPITQWVLSESLRQLRALRDAGYDLSMAVNLGARCLSDGNGFFERFDEEMERWQIEPEQLTLELTEIAFLDTEIPDLVNRFRTLKGRLSIDDFGTGYSSLVYLQRLPIVEIKADRSFVTKMASVKDDAVIVRSIIDLGHNLGLKVVAEGVEDAQTVEMLIAYGCDLAQGYYFSKPLPGDELVRYLDDSAFGLTRTVPTSPSRAGGSLIRARVSQGRSREPALVARSSDTHTRSDARQDVRTPSGDALEDLR